MADTDGLLERWFGAWDDSLPLGENNPQMRLWWGGGPELDVELRDRFGEDHLEAARGALDAAAAEDPRVAMARVLLLDQIPRNAYRATAHAFATDVRAQAATHQLLAGPLWERLPFVHRYFALMPLMHAETLAAQDLGVREFRRLAEQTQGLARSGVYAGALDYMIRHQVIVARFGRFPHRNAYIGRPSTPEELHFLTLPGSSF